MTNNRRFTPRKSSSRSNRLTIPAARQELEPRKVIEFMHANDVNDALAQTETDRYIAWPGQALAYKMGQLSIRKLREQAKTQLGPKFDIKGFHDVVLSGGAMPLDLLQERVEHWIQERSSATASSPAP